MRTRVTCFLFSKEMERTRVPGKILVSTCGDSVISLSTEADLNNISGSTHEECHKKIIIRTADTDVVVLAISVVEEIKVEELRIAFGTGKHFRYIATHAIVLVHTNQELCGTVSFFGRTE